jgi:transposase
MPKQTAIQPPAEISNPCGNESPRFHKFYVGVDIGFKFHEASCISFGAFTDTNASWKRSKTIKFNSDGEGIDKLISSLKAVSRNVKDFCVLMEPTGGYYGFVVMSVLLGEGYPVFYVENKAVKDFRERNLGIHEKSDRIDCKVIAYMGFQKAITPSMYGIRTANATTPMQAVFRSLTTDRWSIQSQITRRKNQLQQILAVTHPELKSVFTSGTASITVRRLVAKYPTAHDMTDLSAEEITRALIEAGGKTVANKKSAQLKELLAKTPQYEIPYLLSRQNIILDDLLRLEETLSSVDQEINNLLAEHPYRSILFSLPTMSSVWAATLIGVIGDIDRFTNYKQFKRYCGFTAENKQSGISVKGSHLSYQGTRQSRRVLFQMVLTLLTPNVQANPFKEHYNRLVARNMPKLKAMGHVAGKLSQVIYGCLKTNTAYDKDRHWRSIGASIVANEENE